MKQRGWILGGLALLLLLAAFGAGWWSGRNRLAGEVADSVAVLRHAVDSIDQRRAVDSAEYVLYRKTADRRVEGAAVEAARFRVIAGARLERADSLAAELTNLRTTSDSLRLRTLEVGELRAVVLAERARGDSLEAAVGVLRETVIRGDSLLAVTRRSGVTREELLISENARLRIDLDRARRGGKLFGLFPAPKCGPGYSAVLTTGGTLAHGPGVSCVLAIRF